MILIMVTYHLLCCLMYPVGAKGQSSLYEAFKLPTCYTMHFKTYKRKTLSVCIDRLVIGITPKPDTLK